MIEKKKYIRKPLYVDAVQVTTENFDEIVTWCMGEVEYEDNTNEDKKYIKVRVHNPKNIRQSKAFVGDWLLYTERGYKVYTNKAFHASFNPVIEVQNGEGESQNGALEEAVEEVLAESEPSTSSTELTVPITDPSFDKDKRVLSIREQKVLGADEVRDLILSGEAVLEQDLGSV